MDIRVANVLKQFSRYPALNDVSLELLARTAVSERTTIFGLSPTAAVVIAAALLVVVILAIVAMTRSNDTYIDTNRRI